MCTLYVSHVHTLCITCAHYMYPSIYLSIDESQCPSLVRNTYTYTYTYKSGSGTDFRLVLIINQALTLGL